MAKIKKITTIKNEDVYDISVPETVNFFANDILVHNCVEIGMYPVLEVGKKKYSGWEGCNLSEINGVEIKNEEDFFKACRGAAILGTLQAGYTDFKFVSDVTKKIFDREALIGVSITGWMNSPKVLLNEKTLKKGAEIVNKVNEELAKLLGINPAARTTCTKPSGNASVLLRTASGIHGEHSPLYIRHIQMTKDSEIAQLIKEKNPYMIEESVWSANKSDYVIGFPVISPRGSIYKKDLKGVSLLEKVKMVQKSWVEEGTREEYCVDPTVRHNVSNTVQVPKDEWGDVEEYLFKNREFFAGVSFLPDTGDKDYAQAPMTEVKSEKDIIKTYGPGALFASGLIVDATTGFSNLWEACMYAQSDDLAGGNETLDSRKDWIRRFRKFADNYFGSDLKKTEYCLKDVFLLFKWNKIQQNFVDINFVDELKEKVFTDVDTMGSAACIGGACEI